jgi:hypothetical protein
MRIPRQPVLAGFWYQIALDDGDFEQNWPDSRQDRSYRWTGVEQALPDP